MQIRIFLISILFSDVKRLVIDEIFSNKFQQEDVKESFKCPMEDLERSKYFNFHCYRLIRKAVFTSWRKGLKQVKNLSRWEQNKLFQRAFFSYLLNTHLSSRIYFLWICSKHFFLKITLWYLPVCATTGVLEEATL